MNPKVSQRLSELGIELPAVVAPVASYVPALVTGDTVRTSGQLPMRNGQLTCTGAVDSQASVEAATEAARQCALNALAAAAEVAGGVDNLARVIKVTGFVASTPEFTGQPGVINGASDFFYEVFSSLHVRSAVGVAALPLGASVEVEVEFALKTTVGA